MRATSNAWVLSPISFFLGSQGPRISSTLLKIHPGKYPLPENFIRSKREKQCLLAPETVHVNYKCAGEVTHRGSAFILIRPSGHPQPTLGTSPSPRLSIACRHADIIAKGTEQECSPRTRGHVVKTFHFSFTAPSVSLLLA